MSARIFVDAGVLLQARDRTDEDRNRRALEWIAELWDARAGRLSWHVLRAYYVIATKALDPPRDAADAREDVTSLTTWDPAEIDLVTMDAAWALEDRFGLAWSDALVVATAKASGCTHLLTDALPDGQEYDGVMVWSPFEHEPAELLGDLPE